MLTWIYFGNIIIHVKYNATYKILALKMLFRNIGYMSDIKMRAFIYVFF